MMVALRTCWRAIPAHVCHHKFSCVTVYLFSETDWYSTAGIDTIHVLHRIYQSIWYRGQRQTLIEMKGHPFELTV
ncbi:uncharacterized protein ARMOST_20741 [Armillaria ostoyae]|uniref:Uncharacterized protein n=1 Tax=Armillaria ostoyae TaxID=47428 RepID=A0A284S854_ARMOS|nr:uncharacterized protein ARMOST_20741 [Armillaria ostoyae]